MSTLAIAGLTKRYGEATVVDRFGLEVAQGEFVALLGPSGCGKTTILRMIAGLVEPSGGTIRIGERDVTWLPIHKRRVGLVFQSYALFPHMSVFENVAFGLRRLATPKAEIERRVGEALAMVRLDAFAERFPAELSGGQQQRVAVARAIAPQPGLLLLDEPLSNLDAQLREEMQVELKRLQGELGITTVFVTHDQGEALAMSDRVCVLSHGRLQQVGTPEAIYRTPANSFVAGFLGRSNIFRGEVLAVDAGQADIVLDCGLRLLGAAQNREAGASVTVTLRQEAVQLAPGARGPGDGNAFGGRIAFRAFAGSSERYVVQLDDGPEIISQTSGMGSGQRFAPGDAVIVRFPAEALIVTAADAP